MTPKILLFILIANWLSQICVSASDTKSSSDNAALLQKFLEEKAASLGLHPCDLPNNLSDQVDSLILDLLRASQSPGGDKLIKGVIEVIHVDDVLKGAARATELANEVGSHQDDANTARPPTYRRKPSLSDAIDDEETKSQKQHVVHTGHMIDYEKLSQQVKEVLSRMPSREQQLLIQVSSKLNEYDGAQMPASYATGKDTKLVSMSKAILRIAISVAKFGFLVLDKFYGAPDFIALIPYIGDMVVKWRLRGKSFYEILNGLRHATTVLKLIHPNQNGVDAGQALHAKSMVSKAGAVAIKSVVHKAMVAAGHVKISEDDTQEFISRAFYMLLSSIVPHGASCKTTSTRSAHQNVD